MNTVNTLNLNSQIADTQVTTGTFFEGVTLFRIETPNGSISVSQHCSEGYYLVISGEVTAGEVAGALLAHRDKFTEFPTLSNYLKPHTYSSLEREISLASGRGPIDPTTPFASQTQIELTAVEQEHAPSPQDYDGPFSWSSGSDLAKPQLVSDNYSTTYVEQTEDQAIASRVGLQYRGLYKIQKANTDLVKNGYVCLIPKMPMPGENLVDFYKRVAEPSGVTYGEFLEANRLYQRTNFPSALFIKGTIHTTEERGLIQDTFLPNSLEAATHKDGVFKGIKHGEKFIPYDQALDFWVVPVTTKPSEGRNTLYENARVERDEAYAAKYPNGVIKRPEEETQAMRQAAVRYRYEEGLDDNFGVFAGVFRFFEMPEVSHNLGKAISLGTILTMVGMGAKTAPGKGNPTIVRTLDRPITLPNGTVIPKGAEVRFTDRGLGSHGDFVTDVEIVVPGARPGMVHNPRQTLREGNPNATDITPTRVAWALMKTQPQQLDGVEPILTSIPPLGGYNPVTATGNTPSVANGQAHVLRSALAMQHLVDSFRQDAQLAREQGDLVAANQATQMADKLQSQLDNGDYSVIEQANIQNSWFDGLFSWGGNNSGQAANDNRPKPYEVVAVGDAVPSLGKSMNQLAQESGLSLEDFQRINSHVDQIHFDNPDTVVAGDPNAFGWAPNVHFGNRVDRPLTQRDQVLIEAGILTDRNVFQNVEPRMTVPQSVGADVLANASTQGFTAAEADMLLQQVVYSFRHGYTNDGRGRTLDGPSVRGACGLGAGTTAEPFKQLGLFTNEASVQAYAATTSQRIDNMHAFTVATIPVRENGEVVDKHYLIDPTYKQFCTTEDVNLPFYSEPGYHLAQTDAGVNMANELLRNGYVELTPETGRLYIESFTGNQPLHSNPSQYVDVLLNPQLNAPDYDTDELEGWGYQIHFY